MSLSLFNTASGAVEPFEPYDEACVRLYVCGPTVYDCIHLGNARSLVVFDLLAALLRRHYKKLLYVRNITDVDDKILARTREEGIAPSVLTAQTIESFHADARALGCSTPDEEPRATQHVKEMKEMIELLLESGKAYASEDGHVLFSVKSFQGYGKLSKRASAVRGNADCLEGNLDGARVAPLPCRRAEGDFVLWKPATEQEEGWDSPWGQGRGRPGWHIECSAMSRIYLGGEIDIHGGGQDLIFPHHENEIAQSRTAHPDEPFVKLWMHNGYVLCGGKKMSKSLGNFHQVCDLLKRVSGEAIRLTLLRAHYRHPLDFSMQRLCESEKNLDRLYAQARFADDKEADTSASPAQEEVEAALCNDLNTPLALERLFFLAGYVSEKEGEQRVRSANALKKAGGLLGLLQDEERLAAAKEDKRAGKGEHPSAPVSDTERAWIEARVEARLKARERRDFAAADAIRFELASRGIEIEDGREGSCWRIKALPPKQAQTRVHEAG